MKVDLIFTRDRAFYFTTVFIPGIILVTSSFITFWLEWNAVPARSMIGNSLKNGMIKIIEYCGNLSSGKIVTPDPKNCSKYSGIFKFNLLVYGVDVFMI